MDRAPWKNPYDLFGSSSNMTRQIRPSARSNNPYDLLDSSRDPSATTITGPSSGAAPGPAAEQQPPRRRRHRAGKKKRHRRKSFAVAHDDSQDEAVPEESREGFDARGPFYSMHGRSLSNASLDSQELLDHR